MSVFPRYAILTSLSLAVALASAGCHKDRDQIQNPTQDPASANIAPISNTTSAAPAGTDYSQNQPPGPPQCPAPAPAPDLYQNAHSSDQYPPDQYSSDQ